MQHIAFNLKRVMEKDKATERGELMRYFCKELNRSRSSDGLPPVTMGRMAKLIEAIPTKDLYYLKRVCDDSTNFSKKFWWEINPKKHEAGDKKTSSAKRRLK